MATWSASACPRSQTAGLLTPLRRSHLALLHDAGLVSLAYIAILIIENPGVSPKWAHLTPLLLLVPISLAVSILLNLHKFSWRFFTLTDMYNITAVASSVTVAYVVVRLQVEPSRLPPEAVLFWFILFASLVTPRVIVRQVLDQHPFTAQFGRRQVPVLVAGTAPSVETFLRACRSGRGGELQYRPHGLLVPGPVERGRIMHGVPILGAYEDFGMVVEEMRHLGLGVEQVVVSCNSADMTPGERRTLYETAEAVGVRTMRLPRVTDLEQPEAASATLKPLSIFDLLGRRPGAARHDELGQRLIAGARVLVTGAGGTIGSELSRQIAKLNPAELVLLDNCEYNSYRIALELAEAGHGGVVQSLICDVRDSMRVQQIIGDHRPEIIFHAAALKHVTAVENNPAEGVLTNVLGTCNVVDAALASGCRLLTFISTDKAVDPTTIMGATKRIGECYCQSTDAAAEPSKTRFIAVRFGNVAGSSGSVIPLFARQISQGGPITVTHPDARRFFMTIEEAAKLVLSASGFSIRERQASQVYLLEMGEPIRIAELAAQMARMAGLVPGRDISIKFVGLKPGEKLDEALFRSNERLVSTGVPQVLAATSTPMPFPLLRSKIDQLVEVARSHDADDVRGLLWQTLAACDAPAWTDAQRRRLADRLVASPQVALEGASR